MWPPRLRAVDACMLDCPKLNCTGGTALCFALKDCIAMDVSFGLAGRAAVARLRFIENVKL